MTKILFEIMNKDFYTSILEEFSPGINEYLTYEELLSKMRDKENLQEIKIGQSAKGENIFGYEFGEGKIRVIVYGLPHSDEPIGTLTVEYIGEILNERKDFSNEFSFLLIPCIDPDGLKLNEGWLKGDFSPIKFFLNRYHRPDEQDIDWAFPIETKNYSFKTNLPETRTIIEQIQHFQPQVFASLHSIQFSGIHFYFDKNYMHLFDKIETFVENMNIPLQKGRPFFVEEGWEYRPGFYRYYTTKEMISEYIREGIAYDSIRRGEFSAAYFSELNPNGISVVPEMPLYYDKELNNLEIGDRTKQETSINSQKLMLNILDFIEPLWKKNFKVFNQNNSQFARIREIVEYWRKEIEEEIKLLKKNASNNFATRSEIFSNEIVVMYNNCNILGSFYQLIQDSELLPSQQKSELNDLILEEIKRIEKEVLRQSSIQISTISEMTTIQTFTILQTLDFFKNKKRVEESRK